MKLSQDQKYVSYLLGGAIAVIGVLMPLIWLSSLAVASYRERWDEEERQALGLRHITHNVAQNEPRASNALWQTSSYVPLELRSVKQTEAFNKNLMNRAPNKMGIYEKEETVVQSVPTPPSPTSVDTIFPIDYKEGLDIENPSTEETFPEIFGNINPFLLDNTRIIYENINTLEPCKECCVIGKDDKPTGVSETGAFFLMTTGIIMLTIGRKK